MTQGTPATRLPLAELHCHIEGTVRPELALRLAARHGMDLSGAVDPVRGYLCDDFAGFIRVYDAMAAAVRTPEDYITVTLEYYERAARAGLVYGEMFISSVHAEESGIAYPTFIDALGHAFRQIEARHGTVCRAILTAIRHLGPESALHSARLAERHPSPYVVGFGLAGDETVFAPADFAPAFAIAEGAGLGLTAHAGELAGPQSVRASLDALPLSRLGHGVRAHEDAALPQELKARGIALELCPTSNIALRLYPSYAAHPIGRYLREGLKVTIGTDDPGFFKGEIGDEYGSVQAAHGLSDQEMVAITRNAVEAAFCDPATKARLLQRIDAWPQGQSANAP